LNQDIFETPTTAIARSDILTKTLLVKFFFLNI